MPNNRANQRRRRRFVTSFAPFVTPGNAFPAHILSVRVELLLNGVWTDISEDVKQRDPIAMGRGRPDWTQQLQPASLSLTINNKNGNYSPRNVNGTYYPFLTRNTQIRVSVNSTSASGVSYSGYRFWGEVPFWPQRWDLSGNDVYTLVVGRGLMGRYQQAQLGAGSSLKRYYALLNNTAYAPVAYWPCEDGSASTFLSSALPSGSNMTFTGTPGLASDSDFLCSDPIPLLNNSVWTGATNSFSPSGDVFFTTPGLQSWVALATTATAKGFGAAGGGGNGCFGFAGGGGEYGAATLPFTIGNTYQLYVGMGGDGGTFQDDGSHDSGGNGEDSWIQSDSGTTRFNGGSGGNSTSPGSGGTGSGATTHHDGGTGGGRPHGAQAGGGGGSSGGTAASGNTGGDASGNTGGSAGAAPTGGFKGGRGGNAPLDDNIASGDTPGGGGGAGAHNSTTGAARAGRSGGSGRIELVFTPTSAPTTSVVRCLLSVPSTGATNSAVLLRMNGTSTVDHAELYYGTGGKLGFRAFNAASATLFDSGLLSLSIDGKLKMITMELAQSGGNITWKINHLTVDTGAIGTAVTGSFVGTMGSVSTVVANPAGTIADVALGHISVQYAVVDLSDASLQAALLAHNAERAATRFLRLCTEAGVSGVLTGNASDTPLMGPQLNLRFADLLQECEDVDMGLMSELRSAFGLGYRTRVSLQNQSPDITLDYGNAHLSPDLEPTDDDTLIRNDITIARNNGAQTHVELDTGALSTLDPPNGVGRYTYTASVNLNADSQTVNMASWNLTLGTLDKTRYPVITVDLARYELAGYFGIIPALDAGDYMQVQNMPAWMPETLIKELLLGFNETINVASGWEFAFNAVPEDVFEGASLPTW